MAESVNCVYPFFTLQCKVIRQIFLGARWLEVRKHGCSYVGFGAIDGVADDLFEGAEIVQVAFAAGRGDAAGGLGAIAVVSADDLNHPGIFKNAEVAAEIAVSERTELLEIVEGHTFGVGDEGGEHAEARSLVDGAVEAFVGEAAFAAQGLRFHSRSS